MGLQQSKDELLYQQVSYGNSEGIKKLRSEGAGLEWMDNEGKTPLILASMNPQLYDVAKTLIELGANVNAYRPGRHAGSPLHHAAKRGLEPMVKLLLAHGANALVMNDDCQTALDVARFKGFSNVVRVLENHLCLFSGWLQELYGPGFLELLAPQLLSRKVWVVVLPCGARKLTTPFKLELAMYSSIQDAKPRALVALWKANMDEPNFNQPDPTVVITCSNKTRIKLTPVSESEKPQLQRFCNACKGIPQVTHSAFPFNNQASIVGPPQTTPEDPELALAITASLQSSSAVGPTAPNTYHGSSSSTPSGSTNPTTHNIDNNKKTQCEIEDVGTSSAPIGYHPHSDTNTYSQIVPTAPMNVDAPSAPPLPDIVDDGPIHYPSIDSTDIDLSEKENNNNNNNNDSSSCVICLDAPVEGACIPCGHMAGCMTCLNEIKSKNWGCPVCRTKIDQVIRLYAV
ncbi:putative transcription factor C2H2 family [Helianthus annuus]|nr:putative transcription factor C2H2 family [Helianthus annuus]KAJ0609828.1 putative transcription factor C2H2 family [Helianthus annuus]KAJ0945784.1 putative transcription factor C2H2 family [Helianthus annuus]